MFSFFDTIIDYIFVIFNFFINTIKYFITLVELLLMTIGVGQTIMGFVPPLIGSCMVFVCLVSFFKLILGRDNK